MSVSPFHGIFSSLPSSSTGGSTGDDAGHSAFGLGASDPASAGQQAGLGRVAVDIYEQDDYYIIRAPIAGVRLADLDIEVNERTITIRGNRRQPDQIPDDQYYLQECFWGPFSRSVTLPTEIDPRKVRATFNKECVLKILIPKEERVKIVKITEG
ncbi:MAG: HSP20 family protein [Candidatus Peregrinibacteria bacterium Greene0416_19]|nr:MAG: HSP20 family protein [Candidatus Peregrinibacteria bacterium Greene0416_19]